MPLRQYFVWVGSVLLVALFAADWFLPVPVDHPHLEIAPNEMVNLRIRSDHKWPERVVFDTARSEPSPAAKAQIETYVLPSQNLDSVQQRRSFDAFAAIGSTEAASPATNENASAIRARPRPTRRRIARIAKAD
jgi:hypothetical protein